MTRALLAAGGRSFSPPDASTPLGWWLRGDDVTLNGADVSSWNDKSGNSRHWTQGTAADQPLFVASAINSRPGVTFDAANTEWLNGPNLVTIGLTGAESFLVVRADADPPAGTQGALYRTGSAASFGAYPWSDSNIYDEFGSAANYNLGNPTPSLTVPRIYGAISTASEWTNFLDGVQLATTAVNTVGWSAAPRLGATNTAARWFAGTVCEWLVYTAKLSASDRARVMAYLKSRYGIA